MTTYVQTTLFGDETKPITSKAKKAPKTKSSDMNSNTVPACASVSPSLKRKGDKLEVNMETVIRYDGRNIPITEYFTQEEIQNGLTDENGAGTRKITEEDIRKKMEPTYQELIEHLATMVYNKEKNIVIPVLDLKTGG